MSHVKKRRRLKFYGLIHTGELYIPPAEKVCNKCGVLKAATEFFLRQHTSSGSFYKGKRRNICKKCEMDQRGPIKWKPRHPLDRRTKAYLETPEGKAHLARRNANFKASMRGCSYKPASPLQNL